MARGPFEDQIYKMFKLDFLCNKTINYPLMSSIEKTYHRLITFIKILNVSHLYIQVNDILIKIKMTL